MIKVIWLALRMLPLYMDEYDGRTAFMILDTGAGKEGYDVIIKDWEILN